MARTKNAPKLTTEQRKVLNTVIRWLAAGAPHTKTGFDFDMSRGIAKYGDTEPGDCGTSCCIAGAAVAFAEPRLFKDMLLDLRPDSDDWEEAAWPDISYRAREILGLNRHQAKAIFHMRTNDPHAAAAALRNFRDRGDLPEYDDTHQVY